MTAHEAAPLFYSLTLPPPWQVRRRDEGPFLDGSAPDGARLMVTPRSIDAFNAEVPVRRKTLRIELERARVKEIALSEGTLGRTPALLALYMYGGRPQCQLSAVKDGIEYRVALTATSEGQRREVMTALERGFDFPDAAEAARVAPTLAPALNAHQSALHAAREAAAAARAALPGGGGGAPSSAPPDKRRP